MVQNHKNKISDQDIIKCFEEKKTLHQSAADLNMTTVTLWRRARRLGLKWKNIPRKFTKFSLEDILAGKHPEYQTFKLKNKLIAAGIKENRCEVCDITEWNGKPIKMQLDHIDGDPHNHRLENLQMICPNCHSQTETYCGKNK